MIKNIPISMNANAVMARKMHQKGKISQVKSKIRQQQFLEARPPWFGFHTLVEPPEVITTGVDHE